MVQQNSPTPDESLRAEILAIFAADGRVTFSGLRVGVLNGIVHLAGAVDSLPARAAAEELASQVDSVRAVVNRIVAPGAPSPAREINLKLIDEK